jgi:hypothetical protein
MMIFECQVLTHGVALMLLGCMGAWSVLLIDELNIVGSYIKYRPKYIYSIFQYVINGQIFDTLAH